MYNSISNYTVKNRSFGSYIKYFDFYEVFGLVHVPNTLYLK